MKTNSKAFLKEILDFEASIKTINPTTMDQIRRFASKYEYLEVKIGNRRRYVLLAPDECGNSHPEIQFHGSKNEMGRGLLSYFRSARHLLNYCLTQHNKALENAIMDYEVEWDNDKQCTVPVLEDHCYTGIAVSTDHKDDPWVVLECGQIFIAVTTVLSKSMTPYRNTLPVTVPFNPATFKK